MNKIRNILFKLKYGYLDFYINIGKIFISPHYLYGVYGFKILSIGTFVKMRSLFSLSYNSLRTLEIEMLFLKFRIKLKKKMNIDKEIKKGNKKRIDKQCRILREYKEKGAAWQSQDKAAKLFRELKKYLSDGDIIKLGTAHNHYEIGEGSKEFYDICNELIKKYCNHG